jgi:Tol biopolymer transport system component
MSDMKFHSGRQMRHQQIMNYLLFLVLLSFVTACKTPTDTTKKLNVDRDIPPSADYSASYGFWGPDGISIYYSHDEKLGSNPDPGRLDELWKLNLKTGKRHMIHAGRILFGDISPNGEWIVFNSFALPQYLYKMRSNGTDLTKLTGPHSPNPDWKYTIGGKWSYDGSHILFSLSAGIPRGVSLMDSSGAKNYIIISYGVQPSWFLNGKHIVYINWDTTQVRHKQEQIYIANADGSNPQKITNLSHPDYIGDIGEPVVSPDGERIAFTNKGEDHREIFLMDIDGSEIEQVTEGPGYAARPEWSPDGKTILFSRIIPNVSKRLYYLDPATHQVTPVFPAEKTHNHN